MLLPSRCGVCGKSGSGLCPQCLSIVEGEPIEFQRAGLAGSALTHYSEPISELLISFKERSQAELANLLAERMFIAFGLSAIREPWVLVPLPSSAANFSRRGFTPARLLAQQLARRNSNLRVRDCLQLVRRVSDQVGLETEERFRNMHLAMRVNQTLNFVSCVLVDDVVTSGASCLEARRALAEAGCEVSAVWAVALAG